MVIHCRVCDRFRDAVNGATGRLQWAKVQRDKAAIRRAEKELAEFSAGWGTHNARAHGEV